MRLLTTQNTLWMNYASIFQSTIFRFFRNPITGVSKWIEFVLFNRIAGLLVSGHLQDYFFWLNYNYPYYKQYFSVFMKVCVCEYYAVVGLIPWYFSTTYCDGFAQSINLWNQKTPLQGNKHIPNAGKNRRIAVSIKIEECHHC
jgi:hypothetical protein